MVMKINRTSKYVKPTKIILTASVRQPLIDRAGTEADELTALLYDVPVMYDGTGGRRMLALWACLNLRIASGSD
jgi:hypothetical protein